MWVEEISIESFGACKHVMISDLGPGLTVIVGPNEAGKSTILEFMRCIFFGFRKKSGRTNIYETPEGTPRRGWVSVRTRQSRKLRVQRTEKVGSKEGILTISDERGDDLDSAAIPLFRAGLERGAYETLFAFDLDRLRQLDQEALRGKIVSAALGSVAVNPLDILKKLGERIKQLMKQSLKEDESLWAIQSRMSALDKQLKELALEPEKHSALKARLETVDHRRRQISAEIESKEVYLQNLANTNRYEDQWRKLVSLDHESLRFQDARDFPTDGIPRLEQASERTREASQEASELEERLRHLKDQVARLNPDMALLEHTDSLHMLVRDARSVARRPQEIQQWETALTQSNRNLEEEIATLGSGWNRDRVVRSDPSLVLDEEIRIFMDSWRTSSAKITGLETRRTESGERVRLQEEKIERKAAELAKVVPHCEGYLEPDVRNRLQEWKELHSEISGLDMRLSDKAERVRLLIAEREEVDTNLKSLADEPASAISPVAFWTLMALLNAAGISMLVSAWLSSAPVFHILLLTGSCMILSSAFVVRWKVHEERRRRIRIVSEKDTLETKKSNVTHEIGETETGRRALVQQIHNLRQNLRGIARDVLGDPDAGTGEVLEAERGSLAAEEPFRRRRLLEEGLKSDRADLDFERSRNTETIRLLAEAESELETLKGRWDDFAADKGLDTGLKPETALELVRRLREVKSKLREISEQQDALETMKRDWEEFSHRVSGLAQEMGRLFSLDVSPVDQVELWGRAEREASDSLSEKKVLLERVKEHEIHLRVLRRKMEDADSQIDALMEAAGAEDEESFRDLSQRHTEYKIIEQERRVLVDSLLAGLRKEDEEVLRREMQARDWDESRRMAGSLEEALQHLREESEGLAREAGMLTKEIETLEAQEETDRLLAEKEELLARFSDGLKEWIVFKLSSDLLEQTIRMYESEKQPKLLARSSEIFNAVTGNSYKKVLFPLDGDRVKVERADGARIEEELLSRGTQEQLYLSMRLAHLDVYHREKFNIPMMMDDVLVNFDSQRATRTADALVKFAEETGLQILFFTCHPHTAALFPDNVARFQLGATLEGQRSLNW
ncbi:MAG: AAA family ATPase [Desulfomonilaceae bacterium]